MVLKLLRRLELSLVVSLSIVLSFWVFVGHVLAADEALEKFRQDRMKARTETYVERAGKEIERGSYLRAIRLLSEALNRGAGPEAHRLRAHAFFLAGSYGDAIDNIRYFINAVPSDPSGYVLLGDIYAAKQEYEAALTNYELALKTDPFFVDAYSGRGMVFAAVEKYALAMQDFQVVLQAHPNDSVSLANMATVCIAADLPQAALNFFQKALEFEKDPETRKILERRIAEVHRVSNFEDWVGGFSGYLASASNAYERTSSGSLNSSNRGTPSLLDPLAATQPQKSIGLPSKQKIGPNIGEGSRQKAGSSGSSGMSGSWSGTYLGLKWDISFRTTGNKVSGSLGIVSPSGKRDNHIFEGTMNKDHIEATAQSGFRFSGKLTEDFKIVGTATTPDGKSIHVDMPIE